ncbi:MAG TPA: D-alanine--D-alanine ligase family protein [Candidatus Binataceae bacterium]|nr:D-alanine--D-alanine ligase family protein [Candidatus Binataceae bacterium]
MEAARLSTMAHQKRLRVGVLFGGRSSEHEISLRSALTVMSAMDPEKYELVPIGIDRAGKWFLERDALKVLAEKTEHLGALDSEGTQVTLLPHSRELVPAHTNEKSLEVGRPQPGLGRALDVVFPVLHGTYGEDGTVQGLLELAGVAYVGAGVLGSAIGIDKDAQKRLLRDAGVPVVRYHAITRAEYADKPSLAAKYARDLGYPVFVKPNSLGSSVGVSKVKQQSELQAALDDAFKYDRKALIEESCVGREIELSVLGNDHPEASLPGEIIIKGSHDFYSYESKYVDEHGSATIIPADLPKAAVKKFQTIAIAAFKALDLRGMARVDFLATRDLKKIYINEVNTIPGFTSISMYPKLWEVSGLPLPKLIDRLIELAIEEHGERAALSVTYHRRK